MSLRARWLQAGGLLALSVVLLGAADLTPYATCGSRSGLQPYVCLDYGDPWAVPLLFAGLASLAAALALLWWLAGAWDPLHAPTFRLLLLVGLAGSALIVLAWSVGAPDLLCIEVSAGRPPSPPCELMEPAWRGWAYAGGGALVGGALASAGWLAFLRAPR